jgi:hypothetical protein
VSRPPYFSSEDRPDPDDLDDGRHRCTDGWLGEDLQGRPIPCQVCRRSTVERRAQLRRRLADGGGAAR